MSFNLRPRSKTDSAASAPNFLVFSKYRLPACSPSSPATCAALFLLPFLAACSTPSAISSAAPPPFGLTLVSPIKLSNPRISVIKLNGFIKYFNPMIPRITLPRPSNLSKNVESSPNKPPRPSSSVVVSPEAISQSLPTTNKVLSTNSVSCSRFLGSDIHFSSSLERTAPPKDNKMLVIGLKKSAKKPKAPFDAFLSLLVILTFGFFFKLPTS